MIRCPRCGYTSATTLGNHVRYNKCGVTPADLFWMKVDKHGPNGCWVWTGYRQKFGHGWTRYGLAHRYAWTLLRGEIPAGKFLCHTCDNPPCVNPDHLYVGDRLDNQGDMKRRGRSTFGERNPKAKMTAAQVIEMRRLRSEEGLTLRELSERFPITETVVQQICAGKKWKHLL